MPICESLPKEPAIVCDGGVGSAEICNVRLRAQILVGADAHIGPLGSCEFAIAFRKNGAFCRADVGIGPYIVPGSLIKPKSQARLAVWKGRNELRE